MQKWCETAELEVKKLEKMENDGAKLDYDLAHKTMLADYMCNRHYKSKEWKERNENYKGAVYSDNHSANYHHGHSSHDVDLEMNRIIEKGDTEHMKKLAHALSKHFSSLKMTYPTEYAAFLSEIKMI